MKSNFMIPRPGLAFALCIIFGSGRHPSTTSGAKNHEKSVSFQYPAVLGQANFHVVQNGKLRSEASQTATKHSASEAIKPIELSKEIAGLTNTIVDDNFSQMESSRLEQLKETSKQTKRDRKAAAIIAKKAESDRLMSLQRKVDTATVEAHSREEVHEPQTSMTASDDQLSSYYSYLMYAVLAIAAAIVAIIVKTKLGDSSGEKISSKNTLTVDDEMEDPIRRAKVGARNLGSAGVPQPNLEEIMIESKNKEEIHNQAKAALAVRVSELEAQASKDKASTAALDTAKAALAVRVSELEAQASKDKASTAALETVKEELEERVSELEEHVLSNEEDARVLYDAKRELGNRVIELETQAVEDKARAVALDAAKAALAVRVSELERKVTITLKEKDEVDSLVRELRDSMALHAADLIKTTEAYAAREQSLQRLVKARDAELVGLQERLDRLTLAQNSRDKENQNNLKIIKEHREKKGFLEATTTELKHQVGELEAQRDRLRVKAAHARFGGRQSEGIASRQENSSLRDSVSSSHGAFDLVSSGAENFNMGHMGDFSDSDSSQLPDVFTSPDTTTTAIDSDFDVDSDMDRSRLSDAARKVAPAGRGTG